MKFFYSFFIFFILFNIFHSSAFAESQIIEINKKEYDVVLDVIFATNKNFTNTVVYKSPKIFLHKKAAEKLKIAIEIARRLGYKIKIYDGFRPLEAQKFFFEKFSNENYVGSPDKSVATHTRGLALDCSLIDAKTGKELDFGVPVSNFTPKAHQDTLNITNEQNKNRNLLTGIMTRAGFVPFMNEWWHFNLPNFILKPEEYPKLTEAEAEIDIMSDWLKNSKK